MSVRSRSSSSSQPARPERSAGVMYPLTPIDAVVLTRNHQCVINTVEKFEGRKFDYEPKNELECGYVYKLADVMETHPPPGVADRDSGHLDEAGIASRGTQVDHPRQRGIRGDAAAAAAQRPCRAARRSGPRHARSVCRRQQPPEERAQFSAELDLQQRTAGRVRRRQPQQHVDLCGGSARAGGRRVRHHREHLDADEPGVAQRDHGYAAGARRQHRRPRHRQSQRPGGAA